MNWRNSSGVAFMAVGLVLLLLVKWWIGVLLMIVGVAVALDEYRKR